MENADGFERGFYAAGRWFSWGLTVEDIEKQAHDLHSADYQAGARAWADAFLGWTETPEARHARKLGLRIEEYRKDNGGSGYRVAVNHQ
jgi:hypothetical protein